MIRHLRSAAGENLSTVPWDDYPRPQLRRENWLCLNGVWQFGVGKKKSAKPAYGETILVPFCPESLLSGINRTFQKNALFYYRRTFSVPTAWRSKRLLLHFGAVDQIARVSVNGCDVSTHVGGYLPFSFDVTDFIREGENTVEVCVEDDLSHTLPWGKQKRARGGMWYTPVSGIWQTVWLEPVPTVHFQRLSVRTDGSTVFLTADGVSDGTVFFCGERYPLTNGKAMFAVPEPHYWSPEDPCLYTFTAESGEDKVTSYFALREISVREVSGVPRICLNGKPYFFHGLLDQGYYSDGIYTAPTPGQITEDILAMKSLGFNTLRKHIKVEPERFYYDCDRLGMVVFQDMVNTGDYSFLRDTALPTIGVRHLSDRHRSLKKPSATMFLSQMEETVSHLAAHPCILYWTVFNEGWGQFRADEAYRRLRKLDETRLIDTTSGWFWQTESDVDSYHVYFKPIGFKQGSRPAVLSEFGGYACKISPHSANPAHTYGYRKCETTAVFLRDLRELYEKQVLPAAKKGLCAAIYTQLSDVEDETNGFLTYDRRLLKINPADFADIGVRLRDTVQ